MNRRWTMKEDRFLHAYFDTVGWEIDLHDMGRPVGSSARRVAKLKTTGAWDALTREAEAARDYRKCLGLPVEGDVE